MSSAQGIYRCPYGQRVIKEGLEEMENSDPGSTCMINCSECQVRVRFRTPNNPFTTDLIEGQLQFGGGEPDEDYVWVIGDCEHEP